MTEFTYKQIGEELIESLVGKISDGESVVLLGPRFGGKRFVLRQLRAKLKDSYSHVISVKLSGKHNVADASELNKVLLSAIKRTILDSRNRESTFELGQSAVVEDGFALIDLLHEETSKPVILLVSNVDSIPQHLARNFLENIQSRVDKRKVVTVMSGEYDFRDLVRGPNSPFQCTSMFVLQGFDLAAFKKFFRSYVRALQLEFESEEADCNQLWQWSGGNPYLLRHFFTALMESRAREECPPEEKVVIERYRELPGNHAVAGAYWSQSFRHANQLIARQRHCWPVLRALIEKKSYALPSANSLPTVLELAGVAVREGAFLKFASPWMEAIVSKYYDELRWADLAARYRRWDEAFALYEEIHSERMLRPTDFDDRAEVETAIRELCSLLYFTAASGTDEKKDPIQVVKEIQDIFSKGCRLLLGFDEVSFWRSERGKEFKPISEGSCAETKQLINNIISKSSPPPSGPLTLPQPEQLYGVAAMLESIRSDHLDAVIVGSFAQKTVISPEREYLIKDLVQHFVAAHSHAVRVSGYRRRLERKHQYIKIANDILNELGRNVRDVRQIMGLASSRLHELGFKRVMFSLVDRSEQRIKGVFDDSKDDISQLSSWLLIRKLTDVEQPDIQQLVVFHKDYRIVDDARSDPITSKKIVNATNMRAIAVIPILDRFDEAIGTVHVEYKDREQVLSPGEAEDLKEFGRQLALAIEKIERMTLLESTLDKTPEPMLIVNSEEKLQYLNLPGANLFSIQQPGWRDYRKAEAISDVFNDEILGFIKQALVGERNSHMIQEFGDQRFNGSWLADSIADWRQHLLLWKGKKAGAWAHVQNLTYHFKVLQAFQKIAAAHSLNAAEEVSLEATKLLGHEWGRLWLIDEKDPNLLVSRLCYNIKSKEVEDYFNKEKVKLPPRGKDNHTWLCLDNKEPLVLCYDPKSPDGSWGKTSRGVQYRIVNFPHLRTEFGKEPGDLWLDLPLLAQDKPLGKISLQWEENWNQETFELLKVLSLITAEQLEATRVRDDLENRVKESIRIEVAEKNMADMAHNLSTRFQSLNLLLAHYQILQETLPELKEPNDWFLRLMEDLDTTILRVKEMLGDINPKTTQVNVVQIIEELLKKSIPEGSLINGLGSGSLIIQADAHCIEMALLELVDNSRNFATEEIPLQIDITVQRKAQEGIKAVEIIYEDNGPGIQQESKKRIFERFYSHRPGRKPGLGLGLNYVWRVIRAHEGTIREDGVPGDGVKFIIELPLTEI